MTNETQTQDVLLWLRRWEQLKILGLPADFFCTSAVGFLLVFDSLADLRAKHGEDAPYCEIEQNGTSLSS